MHRHLTYDPHPHSPAVGDRGVALALEQSRFAPGEPLLVYGTLKVDDGMRRSMGNVFLPRVVLVVMRRDEPLCWADAVEDGHNRIPQQFDDNLPIDPSLRVTGWFNFDLREGCDILDPGGRFWLMASFGDHVSERLEFTIDAAP